MLTQSTNARRPLPDAAPEQRTQRSLFGEILDWMLVPLLLLWPMSIAITYLVAKSIANQPFDHLLDDSVTMLAQQMKEIDNRVVPISVGAVRDILRADEPDAIAYQVLGPRGELADGDAQIGLPPDDEKAATTSVQFRNDTLRGTDVRVAYMLVDLRRAVAPAATAVTLSEPRMALLQVAETFDKRAQLANEIIKGVILPQFIILPVALALIWFALARGLAPLADLQRRIRARRPDDLSPIEPGQVPEEISPLVASLNDMLERVSQSVQLQKRFIADAAHQMKTPLAGMRMQSELALRQTSQEEIHRSLEQLSKSSEAATRLINQLLTLARAENTGMRSPALAPVALSELARSVVQDWVQTAFTRNIDIGFEPADRVVLVNGNHVMLRELLNNLVDNALRYTPTHGHVTIRVRCDAERQQALLEIEDTGAGIAATERTHVFERFYRILGSRAEGSGLGLAIVREIARQHDAVVDVFNNPHCHAPQGPGSLFRVSLPLLTSASAALPPPAASETEILASTGSSQ